METNEIQTGVKYALSKLLSLDGYLLEKDANERSVTHRLGLYLQQAFPDWHVDCEYNRDGDVPKRLQANKQRYRSAADGESHRDTEGKTVFPDVIVHRRGTQKNNLKNNLLVIEVKKTTSTVSDEVDLEKLDAFIKELGYHHALFLKLGAGGDFGVPPELRWL